MAYRGKVKRIVRDKGFGFIKTDETEYFFHRSQVEDGQFDRLQEGASVEFDIGDSPKGPRAENVRVL